MSVGVYEQVIYNTYIYTYIYIYIYVCVWSNSCRCVHLDILSHPWGSALTSALTPFWKDCFRGMVQVSLWTRLWGLMDIKMSAFMVPTLYERLVRHMEGLFWERRGSAMACAIMRLMFMTHPNQFEFGIRYGLTPCCYELYLNHSGFALVLFLHFLHHITEVPQV